MKQPTAVVRGKRQDLLKPERRAAWASRPRILLVGRPDRIEVVRHTVQKIRVTIEEANDVNGVTSRLVEDTIAVVVASPIPGHSIRKVISRIRKRPCGEEVAIFALVDDGISGAKARLLYGDGATAVFEWPQDGLVFSRLVVELLAVDLVHGTMSETDAALARTIRAHLKIVRGYGRRLRVRVDAGVSFVSGSVRHLWQKKRIEEMVSNIPGVRSVVVRWLLVDSSDRTDAQIRRSILRLISEASDIDETTLAVNVERGYVTLAGSVTDRRELNRVGWLLANVKGVRHVDRLAVMSQSQKQHDHVAARRLRMTLSHLFPDQKANATFFGGVAVLSGTVERLSTRLYIQSIIEDDDAVQRVINKIEVLSMSSPEGD